MTVRVTGTPFGDIVPEIQEALDTALAGTLGQQQADLSKANPKDTGRMASSWQIGYNAPARPADRGEGWVKPGDPKPKVEILEYSGKRLLLTATWYISNSLPHIPNTSLTTITPSATESAKGLVHLLSLTRLGMYSPRSSTEVKP